MNDRFFCSEAEPKIERLQHFLYCERARRENRFHTMGSESPLDRSQRIRPTHSARQAWTAHCCRSFFTSDVAALPSQETFVSDSDKLGWQQHTTRAALSGLRKAGYQVIRETPPNGGPAKYRILVVSAVEQGTTVEATHHGA